MKGMSIRWRRREMGVLDAMTGWMSARLSSRQLVLGLSLVVGLCTGLVAFVLKWLVEEIRLLLTEGIGAGQMSWLYLVLPAVGILLTALFVRYVVGRAWWPVLSRSDLVAVSEPRHRLC